MRKWLVSLRDKFPPYPGLMSLKPFRVLAAWWPVFIIITYGSYAFWPELRDLGAAAPVWYFGRTVLVLLAVAALIWRTKPIFRELLGHAMLAYTAAAAVSYYLAVPVRDAVFWGGMIRLLGVAGLLYALAIGSFLTLSAAEAKRIMEVPDKDLEKEL